MIASIIFIEFKAIDLGDDKVQSWLISLIISFIVSLLLTQPLEVFILALLDVIIFRKHDYKIEQDHEDFGQPLNEKLNHSNTNEVIFSGIFNDK